MNPELPEWGAERAPWIVVDTDGAAFACRRCGDRRAFRVPVMLAEWVAASQVFVAIHKGCKAPPIEAAQGTLV